MNNVFQIISQYIQTILLDLYNIEICSQDINVEVPKNFIHGDFATNIALILAPKLKMQAPQIAEDICNKLVEFDCFDNVFIAAPGFINMQIKGSFWGILLSQIALTLSQYGAIDLGMGHTIHVEFVSANPTGPLHIGHVSSAVHGDALANLLEFCKYKVVREYYINDTGNQMHILAASVFARYRNIFGYNDIIKEGWYPGEYIIDIAYALLEKYNDTLLTMPEEQRTEIIITFSINNILYSIRQDLVDLGVKHDVFVSEKQLIQKNMVEEALAILEQKKLLYYGILDAPKSKVVDDFEITEQLLFKSTAFGDDIDRPVKRANGTYTYFAADAAYHLDKIKRGFTNMILLLGADHGGYVKRITAVVKALSDNKANIVVKINQIITILKDGKSFKMSKRSGNFVTLREMLDEVGKDVLRFIILTKKSDTAIEINYDIVKEQSNNNPLFYVQYANTRIYSVFKKAADIDIVLNDNESINYTMLSHKVDIEMIKQIALLPKILERAAIHYEPHRITYYLHDLAQAIHNAWSTGIEDSSARFIIEQNHELTKARLRLLHVAKHVIETCFMILGVTPITKM